MFIGDLAVMSLASVFTSAVEVMTVKGVSRLEAHPLPPIAAAVTPFLEPLGQWPATLSTAHGSCS